MFTPVLVSAGRNTSRLIDVKDPIGRLYADSLTPVALENVSLLELLHTLFSDTPGTTADVFGKYAHVVANIAGVYRDAAGTLVVRWGDDEQQRLLLLLPVTQPIDTPTAATIVRAGRRGTVFVFASGKEGPVLLPAATASRCGFSWGYPGTGPINLYAALVYAVTGQDAPTPHPRFNDDPRSLFGWIIRLDQEKGFQLPWPELVHRVTEDEPLRRAASGD